MLLIWSVLIPIVCLWTAGIIFIWSFDNNISLNNYSLFDSVCENVYFKQCTQSRRSWLRCINNINRPNRQQRRNHTALTSNWPPSTIPGLFDDEFPVINLALRIPFTKNAENPFDSPYYRKYLHFTTRIEDNMMRSPGLWSSGYNLFPQTLDFDKVIYNAANGFPSTTLPINNPDILALRLPKSICNPCVRERAPDLIVVIKSCSYCSDERDHARNTFMQRHLWSNITVQFVFVVGIPYPNESNMFTFGNNKFKLKDSWWRLSRKHDKDRWTFIKRLAMEADFHEDILIGSFHDTYFNLSTKLVFTFRWLSALCPNTVPLFLFIDNDYDLVPWNVIKFYRNHTIDCLRDLTGGIRHKNSMVIRPSYDGNISSIWAVMLKEFPWSRYPPYFYGATYILGSNIVKRLAIASAFTQHIRIDDAYLGILFNKLNIIPQNLDIISLASGGPDIESGAINVPHYISKRIIDWKTGKLRFSHR
ncbi:unnamed protein product [Schistosoma rodhaini]|uniref:Hexosyltransferase n=1 Tax=Schistosoma rodhaini TaxID=6188 RepID=A0AA85ENE3_9TREM|nr:unnamed protein product [Schistosoma rodhaini]CAH8680772.1 unnamed protein product [Schistosoma rodhaini]